MLLKTYNFAYHGINDPSKDYVCKERNEME